MVPGLACSRTGFVDLDLRLSGHTVGLDEHAAELLGFSLDEERPAGQRAYVGTGPDGPSVFTVAVSDDYTLMLLSYGLTVDELVELTPQVESGGQILDCSPTEPDCIAGP